MTAVQRQAIKDVLHLIVDKEQDPVVKELLSKLPAPYGGIALSVFSALDPVAISTEDSAIEKI